MLHAVDVWKCNVKNSSLHIPPGILVSASASLENSALNRLISVAMDTLSIVSVLHVGSYPLIPLGDLL